MTPITTVRKHTVLSAAALLGLAVLALAFAMPAQAAQLTQQLEFGMTNPEVATLQTFLAADSTIYPQGLVTSYFGFLTKSAVSNFQSRNNIDAIGRVGPITLAAINMQMANGTSVDNAEGAGRVTNVGPMQPTLSNISVSKNSNSVTITWNSNVPATARVMYSTQWPFSYRNAASVTSTNAPSYGQSVTINNLQSGTTYFYVLESLDPQGNFSWSASGTAFKTN